MRRPLRQIATSTTASRPARAPRGAAFNYNGELYHSTDNVDAEYDAHGALLDTSCLDAHAADGTQWKCRDRQHVLFKHITTPFMVREDFTDPNREHLDAPDGHWIRWGINGYFPYCPDASPCPPRFNAAEFRARIEKQIQTLLTSAMTRSELARGVDKSVAPLPTFFAWMPEGGQHDGSFSDDHRHERDILLHATVARGVHGRTAHRRAPLSDRWCERLD